MSTVAAILGLPGRVALVLAGIVEELGACGLLTWGALGAVARPMDRPGERIGAVVRELSWLFAAGLPIVAFVHVGLGSFLAMQAFYGATFVEGTGAVVGVGLVRNAAPLLSGLLLAGLLANRVVYELRHAEAAADGAARLALPRLVAATIAGPILAFWGAMVGTVVGWQVAETMLGVSTPTFFLRFWDMLWAVDVVGLAIKGALFGLISALFACVEGLRGDGRDWMAIQRAALRAACFASALILFFNSTWFLIVYVGGTPFSPVAD